MAKITVLTPAMEAHTADCGDVERALSRGITTRRGQAEYRNDYEALTLLDAIIECDTDWADNFGADAPYTQSAVDVGAWGLGKDMDIKPCLAKALKDAGIAFDDDGRPFYGTRADAPASAQPKAAPVDGYGTCNCGCGGSPKGKKSRFLGHDMRVGHGARPVASRGTEAKGDR